MVCIVYPMDGQNRKWLADCDVPLLAELIAAFRDLGDFPPRSRLSDALWYFTQSFHTHDTSVRLMLLVATLERLLTTSKVRPAAQFSERVVALASEVGGPPVTKKWTTHAYALRSSSAHGERLLKHIAPKETKVEFNQRIDNDAILLEDLSRLTLRKAMLEPEFCSVLQSHDLVAARWPVPTTACPACRARFPNALLPTCPQCNRPWPEPTPSGLM